MRYSADDDWGLDVFLGGIPLDHVIACDDVEGWADRIAFDDAGSPVIAEGGDAYKVERVRGHITAQKNLETGY